MKKSIIAIAALVAFGAQAQQAPQSNTVGDNSKLDQQIIGDTTSTADHTNSVSHQLGNSANNNGASFAPTVDTRDQNTVNSEGGSATGGAAIGNQSDNKSSAYNGPQSMGQANTGNSSVGNVGSSSGGNILGGSSSGGNSLTNGSNTANNAAAGGAGGMGGAGGQGGTASSNGTNLGINGQQQGIDKSGNSDVKNTNALGQATDVRNANGQSLDNKIANSNAQGQSLDNKNALNNATSAKQGQGQGQQQANTGTNAQGQTSANRNSTGGNTQSTTAGNGAGASAGAGAGANNHTANTTRVDASDRSLTTNTYTSKAVAWAPIIPGPVAAPLASANLVVIPGQCGPRVRLVATNVTGKQFGPFGGQYDIAQGQDIDTTMAQGADGQYEPYIVIGDDVWGQRVDRAIGALGTSSATNFSIGGFTSKGDSAQGGAGGSGSLQQIVARSFVTDCVIGKVIKPAPVVIVEQAVIHRPARADRN